jgi:hypothetical protein
VVGEGRSQEIGKFGRLTRLLDEASSELPGTRRSVNTVSLMLPGPAKTRT